MIIIVLVIVFILVAIGVTLFAQKKQILCFKKSTTGEGDEATGQSPLLKNASSASKLSPSRATSASATTASKSALSGK